MGARRWVMLVLVASTLAACSPAKTAAAPPLTSVVFTSVPTTVPATTALTTTSTSTTGSTVPATTVSLIGVAKCRGSNMTLTVGRSGVGLGHWGVSYKFTNNADTCALEGYPVLLGLNDNGQWETMVVRQSTNAYIPPPPSLSGPLGRGDTAFVTLQGTEKSSYPNNECLTAPKQPPTYRALRFTLPGDATPLQIDGEFYGGCNLTVSPFGAKEQ